MRHGKKWRRSRAGYLLVTEHGEMDVFGLRDRVTSEYRNYVSGFVGIREQRAREFVQQYFDDGRLWPEPLVQLNPSFQQGRTIDQMVNDRVLHPECATIFRRRDEPSTLGAPILLHRHQDEAISVAKGGKSYVLTTGTGSGKSLGYFIPIVDHVLRAGSGQGIKAIVVYPMNALCNSQEDALTRFLRWGYPGGRGPVTFAKYTGQEGDATRRAIITSPPDILLTNFVMLELILTRKDERELVEATQGLEFLVLDELHTYRGRQGADVAMLVRRVRDRCGTSTMRCVGTSATLAGIGTREQRQVEVGQVASRLFGMEVPPENVIGETLRRATDAVQATPTTIASLVAGSVDYPNSYTELARHPLAAWAETAFGLAMDSQGRLERRPPRTLTEAGGELSAITGQPLDRCALHLQSLLMAGYLARDPVSGFPLFAFRLHQFISRGDTVYATPEPPDRRYLSAEGQVYVPGERNRHLYPMAFCRVCGQDYLVVTLRQDRQIEAADLDERVQEDGAVSGFVAMDSQEVQDPLADLTLLPEEWTDMRRGDVVLRASARRSAPRRIFVTPDGRVLKDNAVGGGAAAWFLPAPFRYCLACTTAYSSGREKDFSRLAELSSGGRSTATTLLSLATVRAMRDDPELTAQARKLLSFTDNRQDASLQAGHFNDFVQVTMLRAAILAAVEQAATDGLSADEIAQRVVNALRLELAEYASNPQAQFAARRSTDEALRDIVGYRVYLDLRRGWRVTAPNLEQVGLLKMTYDSLDELCTAPEVWKDLQPDLAAAHPEDRERVCHAVLDYMRRGLAIKAAYLDPSQQERIRQVSYQYLREPWAFDENERLRAAAVLVTPGARVAGRDTIVFTARSLLGRFIRRGSTWPVTRSQGQRLTEDEFANLAKDIMTALVVGGQVEEVPGVHGAYQLQAGVMRWMPGDGAVQRDPIRVTTRSEEEGATNAFFADLYRTAASALHHMEAREHTAQVPAAVREEREDAFGRADLPVLYCSPTMELGVDIRDLNAVNMRNVPPTPANYAQRSGRAGRSGQPALVITYCTSTSPHDQHYFRRPENMVAGEVTPPRLDLANEDLVRAHCHAVWLAETGQSLYSSVSDLLELSDPDLQLRPEVRSYIERDAFQLSAEHRCRRILDGMQADLPAARALWYTPDWLTRTIQSAPAAFDRAADRWRHLYRSAKQQQERQHQIVADPLRTAEEHRVAQRLREEAETQIDLLTRARADISSDFYSYRYFACEGFLPGYNFPRLPVTAFIPARQRTKGREEFLSRARFIAISEFGPRTIIYHEGSRYRVNRVVLPREDSGGRTRSAVFCARCGYGHFADRLNVDLCDRCSIRMDASASLTLDNLLRLESVSAQRVDRISCDEEERLRLGYELRTIFRFATRQDGVSVTQEVHFDAAGQTVASATYGAATTLWRVNLGWNRRKDQNTLGFMLDMERGVWAKSDQEPDLSDDEPDTPARPNQMQRVVPFVEDRRNVLVFQLNDKIDREVLLSLQYALKRGIENYYQLEDAELAAEPLPTADAPSAILFYEASEGGAGVLVRLAEEPQALAEVAQKALELCHFDPASGADQRRAERATEDCEAACYSCLLSYGNQRYHTDLDRKLLPDLLVQLAASSGAVGAGSRAREAQRDALLRLCESALERDFLNWLYDRRLRLPDRAQERIEGSGQVARPDFVYDGEQQAIVYVDGAPHQYPGRQQRDAAGDRVLARMGWTVVRVQGPDSWASAVREYAWIFGQAAEGLV